MTTTPSDDFTDWIRAQLQPEAPANAGQPPPDSAPTAPKPDRSQGGTGITIPPSASNAFAHLIHDHL